VSASWQAHPLTLAAAEAVVVMAAAEAVAMGVVATLVAAVGISAVLASAADMVVAMGVDMADMVVTYSALMTMVTDIPITTAMAVTQPMNTVRVSMEPMGGPIPA